MLRSYDQRRVACKRFKEVRDVKYRATLFMVVLALIAMGIHLWTGWNAFVEESATHGETAMWSDYLIQWLRDTFENLQSEFWQLAMQFAILAGLFHFIGIQQYEEDEEELKHRLDRIEAKINGLSKETSGERGA
jgi:succinate dehydrogenase hydrophobic anchor subunit